MAYWMINHYVIDADEEEKQYFDPFLRYLSLLMTPLVNEGAPANDKQLDIALNKIDNGVKELY